mmetsp:Transcript_94585/g.149571  ORF Transcript_94585/g.149571 Transcript_94585/m.149571 type:complete len:350 (-) Transcript_94585:33-1082(-)|eukprot:CAMPEP_0169070698 /NCGR_PEP_ID=MMETSP1015-20121227/5254_1 /TAXON_ID=342587 /ORGANISM="Karlodinium micrum, Strain CCMP2283" /LENGTH=349 /DNA_ID=CAMNT_0009129713 /DNA_START=159 /DNA_END=1208 /DNA_ORIENTATION=+
MSYRLLQKQCGGASESSSEARSVTQPQNRGRGRGSGSGRSSEQSGGSGGGYYARGGRGVADNSGVAYAGNSTNVMYPAPSGGFHGSSVQQAHVEAMRKATVEANQKSKAEVEANLTLAKKSGLGLEALKERKAKEEEEKQAKREAARARRHNESTKKEAEDEAALQACEEMATADCEIVRSLKYEAALIVHIATKFGESGVWMKIAEARARGANIPLDPRRIYLLAHPDKAPTDASEEMKAKFADATAILNAQRPPEMTEVKIPVRPKAPKEEVIEEMKERVSTNTTESTSAAPEVKVSAVDEKRIDPEDGKACSYEELCAKYHGIYRPEEIEAYWKDECKAKPRSRRF